MIWRSDPEVIGITVVRGMAEEIDGASKADLGGAGCNTPSFNFNIIYIYRTYGIGFVFNFFNRLLITYGVGSGEN